MEAFDLIMFSQIESVRIEIRSGTEIVTGDTSPGAESVGSVHAHVPKTEEIENEVLHQKRVGARGGENLLYIGTYRLLVLNTLRLCSTKQCRLPAKYRLISSQILHRLQSR